MTRTCGCGCGALVTSEQARFLRGHRTPGQPGSRLGITLSAETKLRMRQAALRRYEGKRAFDSDPEGSGRLRTESYRAARALLVEGRPCCVCDTRKRIHAHHTTKGDDSSLVPLCGKCHVTEHTDLRGRIGAPPTPLAGQQPPLCACGCLRPVGWKRGRGWAKFCKGHGTAKVSGVERYRATVLCKCGCGEPTKRHYGMAWSEYKTGHRQRVEGWRGRKGSGLEGNAVP